MHMKWLRPFLFYSEKLGKENKLTLNLHGLWGILWDRSIAPRCAWVWKAGLGRSSQEEHSGGYRILIHVQGCLKFELITSVWRAAIAGPIRYCTQTGHRSSTPSSN